MVSDKTVADIIGRRKQLLTIESTSCVAEAARKMADGQVGSLVVLGAAGETVGIITERDILNKVVACGLDPQTTDVETIMTPSVISVGWFTPFNEAQRLMTIHRIRHLLVTDGGAVVGIVSAKDMLRTSLAACETIIRKQAKVLQDLESQHPGITQIKTDRAGRVLI
ncbi:MAG: CBS domain-containing protein [Phycisphaerae bacterium]|jgi:signal-transduction protein with cAMP-binding, CBS, and nucleotidyltransferase domain